MCKRIITFLILVPLAVLISLPCSIKQDIKQLLSIPINTSVQIEKSSKNGICVYTPVKDKTSQKQQQLNIKHFFTSSPAYFFEPDVLTFYQSTGSDPGEFYSVPIFLIYRKLII